MRPAIVSGIVSMDVPVSFLQSKSLAWLWGGVILFLLNFVSNSFTRLSDLTDCGDKHSKYSIKTNNINSHKNLLTDRIKN